MKVLKNEEMERISGGFSAWVALGIAAALVYVSGIIDGIVHPKACS